MTNTNCLEGIRCPKCGNEERLFITATIRADVTDDGAEAAEGSDMHWDDSSLAICPNCDADGPLKDFRALPPDLDGMNDSRAGWAATALKAFQAETGTDDEDALGDLLGDLMHLCDRNGSDFEAAIEKARRHYVAETVSEGPTKACKRCGESKPLDQFGRNRAAPDRKFSWCKPCRAARRRERTRGHYEAETAGEGEA